MPRRLRKIIVKLRMLYCDIRGHHGKKWNYEPGDNYMGMSKRTKEFESSILEYESLAKRF